MYSLFWQCQGSFGSSRLSTMLNNSYNSGNTKKILYPPEMALRANLTHLWKKYNYPNPMVSHHKITVMNSPTYGPQPLHIYITRSLLLFPKLKLK